MKILFVYPQYTYPRKNPPIGIASLASYIIQEGHDARIIDFNIEDLNKNEYNAFLQEYLPDFIGVSFMTNQYKKAIELIELSKTLMPNSIVIAGGPHASALPEDLLQESPYLDIVVYGEGEIPLQILLDEFAINKSENLSTVPNICFRNPSDGTTVKTPPTNAVFDFTTPPWPAWHLLKLNKYKVFGSGGDQSKLTFALLSSRGCPASCTFCDSHTIFGRKFRGRSAGDLFNEIIYLNNAYGMEQFDFVDDLVTVDKDRLFKFCQLLVDCGKKFTWMANARLNTLNEEMLIAMSKSGCVRIDVGVESGDPNVRKLIKKGITNDQIIKIHKFCKQIGLYVGTFLMVGNFGETMESVRMTAKLMQGLTDDPSIAIACPYPGTELFQYARSNGFLLTTDWSRYGTAPTFLKDYTPVMRTDTMTPEQILDAYYYLQSFFALNKFKARYGRFFYLNPLFIKEYFIESKAYGGFGRKALMGWKLIYSFMKNRLKK